MNDTAQFVAHISNVIKATPIHKYPITDFEGTFHRVSNGRPSVYLWSGVISQNYKALYFPSTTIGQYRQSIIISIGTHNTLPTNLEEILFHEHTHYIDDVRSHGKALVKYDAPVGVEYKQHYYNTPCEIQAYLKWYQYKHNDDISELENEHWYKYLDTHNKKSVIGRVITKR